MKKNIFIVSFFLSLLISTNCLGEPWRVVKDNYWSPTFGQPMKTLDVVTTKEIVKQDAVYYSYKIVIQRPSKDDGTGVGRANWLDYRLYYWAALSGTDPYMTLYNDFEIFQSPHNNPRRIVIHLLEGLRPGKYNISVAVIPYPMIAGYSLKKLIQAARNPYTLLFGDPLANFFSDLQTAVTSVSPQAAIGGIVYAHAKDATVNGIIKRIVNYYGQIIELEVLAKMPKIVGLSPFQANDMLRKRSLIPQPDEYNTIPTNNLALDGKIARCKFAYGARLRAGTGIPYKIFRYGRKQQFTQEICGNGIDDNGNNEIDEGCRFNREIIVDDNKCPDDTIALIIDGQNYGVNPAGHKRHYNISGLGWGEHLLEIYGVKSGGSAYQDKNGRKCSNSKIITYSIKFGKGVSLRDGGKSTSNEINEGKKQRYSIKVE